MKVFILSLFFLISILNNTQASKKSDSTWSSQHGLLVQFTTTFDIPLLDLGKRFGNFYTVGGGLMYKSKRNHYIQFFFEGLISNRVRQSDIFRNIGYYNSGGYYQLYDQNGDLINPQIMLRGFNLGVGYGKTFTLNKTQSVDNGIQLMTSISLLQHRINHYDKDAVLPQALGEYAKGYDYLTNGLCINESINYIHFSRNSMTNFSTGINIRWGLTKNRRSWDFDSGAPSDKLRNDVSIGLQLKWLIPIYKKLDKEIYF